jgi:hypothetical protein
VALQEDYKAAAKDAEEKSKGGDDKPAGAPAAPAAPTKP